VNIILEEGAKPSGIAISIDREEKGTGSLSAVEEIKETHHLPICHLTSLQEIMRYIEHHETYASYIDGMQAYQKEYGITA
jgi:orotate phosphoribosyltransferase